MSRSDPLGFSKVGAVLEFQNQRSKAMGKDSIGLRLAAFALFLSGALLGAGCGQAPDSPSTDPAGVSQFGTQISGQTALQTKLAKAGRPANPSSSGTAVFKFSCNLGTCTYKCSIDSGAYKKCKSPKTYKYLAEGSHGFKVRAYYSGASDPTPAKYYWLVQFPGSWTATSTTNAPLARWEHSAVWSGSEMIIWGGYVSTESNTGAKYNPTTDTWTTTSTTNAPAIRTDHTAIWTGTYMVVWGGTKYDIVTPTYYNTGGKYDPSANTWTATSTTNAPAGRYQHQAVWNGSVMMVWGGDAGFTYYNTGGKYDPGANTWTSMSTTNAPDARATFTAVWDTANSQMIVWGGIRGSDGLCVKSGGRYDATGNNWFPISSTNAPAARFYHTAVWDSGNSKMIVWGGECSNSNFNTGGRFDPAGNSWASVSLVDAPAAPTNHTAVWANTEIIVWGGQSNNFLFSGAKYNPTSNSWTSIATLNAPDHRYGHTAVWTGSKMIVWGGSLIGTGETNTGGVLTP